MMIILHCGRVGAINTGGGDVYVGGVIGYFYSTSYNPSGTHTAHHLRDNSGDSVEITEYRLLATTTK